MNLTQQDIDSILHVIDDSPYDELRLETNGVSVYLKRTAEGWTQQQQTLKQPQLLQGATAATQTAIAQAAPLAAETPAPEDQACRRYAQIDSRRPVAQVSGLRGGAVRFRPRTESQCLPQVQPSFAPQGA